MNHRALAISAIVLVAVMMTTIVSSTNVLAPQAFAVPMTVDFETGVYSIRAGASPDLESFYQEKGFTFQTPLATNQHLDSGPSSGIASPYLSFHEGPINTVDNVILSALGGATFDLISFELILPGNHGVCNNLQLKLTASDGSMLILPDGSSGTINVNFDDITSVTFDIINPDAGGFDVYCIDNLIFDDMPSVTVDIDIKPGSDPSSVDCTEKQPVPLAVFGSASFDATTIDPTTLALNGVATPEIHNKVHVEDKNKDGIPDAVLHLDRSQVCDATSDAGDYPLKESRDATLTGSTTSGPPPFEGIGDIRITKR